MLAGWFAAFEHCAIMTDIKDDGIKAWMRNALTNRKDEEFGEAGDCTPLGLNETTVDAEDDGLDVFRAN